MGEEHEMYGADIPDYEEELVAKVETDSSDKELDEMKRRLKEMEEEAAALKEMQTKLAQEMQVPIAQDPAADQASKQEVDSRSVFVGNVDYSCTPEEVQNHFQSCGTVNRVTIKADKFGHPKGFAYVEFMNAEAVQNALLLNQSELHNRQLKVSAKRTNVPGMKHNRNRGPWFNPTVNAYLAPPNAHPPCAYPPPPNAHPPCAYCLPRRPTYSHPYF